MHQEAKNNVKNFKWIYDLSNIYTETYKLLKLPIK